MCRIRSISALLAALLVAGASASEETELIAEVEAEAEEVKQNLLKELIILKETDEFTGDVGDRCDSSLDDPGCKPGLSCVGEPFSTCQQIDCYNQAVENVFMKMYDMRDYAQIIMREAGIEGREDLWEERDGWFGLTGNKIKPEVEQAVLGALMNNPLPLDEFRQEMKRLCPDLSQDDPDAIKARAATVEGSTVYGGVIFKSSALVRFSNAYFFAQGEADEYAGWYTDICTGFGFEGGIKAAGIVGTIYSGTRDDLEGGSIGFSFDFTPGVGYGVWAGFGVPNCVCRVNSEIGAGVLFGVGGAFCQTVLITDFTPPSAAPSPSPPTASPSKTPTTCPSVSPTLSQKPSLSMRPSGAPSLSTAPSLSAKPSSQPSASPSAKPTPSPTASPTVAPCFSEDNVVHVQDVGDVSMRDLQLGDSVLASNGNYQPIYAFGHTQDNHQPTEFLVLHTNDSSIPAMELTPNHMLYLHNQPDEPIMAHKVQVGNILTHHYHGNNTKPQKFPVTVTEIQSVTKPGVFLPLTTDGTLVVNGMEASVYASLPHAEQIVSWLKPLLSSQTIFHWWLSPLRMLCLGSPSSSACQSYTEDGLLVWLDTGNRLAEFLSGCNPIFQAICVFVAAFLLGVVRFVEVVLGPAFGYAFLLAIVPFVLVHQVSKAKKQERTKDA